MSEEIIGLVRENLSETRELRKEIDGLRTEFDARLDEVRRLVVIHKETVTPSRDHGLLSRWTDVVKDAVKQKPLQWAVLVGVCSSAGLNVSDTLYAMSSDHAVAAQEMPAADDDDDDDDSGE